MKSKGMAWLLWLIGCGGWLGLHNFYVGRIFKGLIRIAIGVVATILTVFLLPVGISIFALGSLIDLFRINSAVKSYNTEYQLAQTTEQLNQQVRMSTQNAQNTMNAQNQESASAN